MIANPGAFPEGRGWIHSTGVAGVPSKTYRRSLAEGLRMPPHQGRVRTPLAAIGLILLLAACAEPRPIFYPNSHYNAVGPSTADTDTQVCRDMAEAAGASRGDNKGTQVATQAATGAAIGGAGGAAVGAIAGNAGRGAAAGAAGAATIGFMRALLRRPEPSAAYRGFVNRCLSERGYAVVGWD